MDCMGKEVVDTLSEWVMALRSFIRVRIQNHNETIA